MIFLHGGPGFKDYLAPYFKELSSSSEVTFYDQLQGPQVTMDDLIRQLDQMVDSHRGSKILAGHSWGGVLAVEYALRYPSKIKKLIIMNTGLSFAHWNDEFKKEKERLGLMNAPLEEIFLTKEESAIGRPFLKETEDTFSGETFDSLYESYLRTFDLTEKLGTLKMPILNIFGEKDVRFPRRIAESLHAYNKNITDCCIAEAGHFPFLLPESREQVLKAIKEFIN